MKVLVLNSGSSSLKYKLFDGQKALYEGIVEHIGEEGGVPDHREALRKAEKALIASGALTSFRDLDAAGHRVVHGGEKFVEPTRIDTDVIEAIRALIPLAPLHNPANLAGIETMVKLVPGLPQVAVFDTAFHQTMPEKAYLYAIPYDLYEKRGIRRYGFHGTSHSYVARAAAKTLGRPLEETKLITLHLGNGASACAVERGRSVETSMGFTPLEGLVMGTRSGDVDPEIAVWMAREGMDADRILNKQSGLKGLCGDNDVRAILARMKAGDAAARRALEVYAHRIRRYVGAYLAVLGGADAIVFTAGVGEHSPEVRRMACENLQALGIRLDEKRNAAARTLISTDDSPVKVLVIPTDEELEIARQTEGVLRG